VSQAGKLWRSLALLSISGVVSGCNAQAESKPAAPPAREVEVLTIAPSEVRDTGEYLGSIVSRQSVSLLPQVTGYVRKIHVRPGQHVKVGDVMVELDARQETAALQSAEARQRAAASSEELASKTFQRTQALHKEGLVTGQELDRAEAEAKAAEAASKAASAEVSETRVNLQFHAVRAPFPGTVGDVLVRLGDFVTASTALTSITEGDLLEASMTIPPERARQVKAGTPIELLDQNGKVLLESSLYFVAPEADPRTQLVDVRATFPNSIGLRPSELVRVRIVYGRSQALQVPVLSVVRQSGQPFVFVVEDKPGGPVVSRHPITLGVLGEQSYVVEKGLTAGDKIAVSSLQALRDGAPVKPKPMTTAAPSAAPPASGVPTASAAPPGSVAPTAKAP
jgi:RND family efflux transporter MFP subunit